MTTSALDFISLASAKNWLNIDIADTDWDDSVTRLIGTAVAWMENYTSYRTYQRTEVFYSRQLPFFNPANYFPPFGSGFYNGPNGIRHTPEGVSVYLFPFTVTSVQDVNSADVFYTVKINALKTLFYTEPNCVITLQTGYPDNTTIPPPLLEACYKMLTYLFENRDLYNVDYPTDIQLLLNQYRRHII
jgi:hypothetical protein